MTSLPASIEAYLKEAGFSATELLLLKRLMEGDAMTLRELASKTGKSTGVLDQAAKKLTSKGIVGKEMVNGTPKYTLSSLDAINEWVRKDSTEKQAAIVRKHQNFEAFLHTLSMDKARPEMQYFEGKEGLQKAYLELVDLGAVWHVYEPAVMKEDENPLRECKVQLFRERHKKKVLAKVLAPNNPMGRRYHDRDAFEYRETRLIEEGTFPVDFEKIIVGDTVACFDHEQQKACFMKYPEQASTEKKMFEMLWQGLGVSLKEEVEEEEKAIPFKTRFYSALRDTFMSKKALGSMVLAAVVALGVTWGLYFYTLEVMKGQIFERLETIVSLAKDQISTDDLDQIDSPGDMENESYLTIFYFLNEIRDNNPDLKYVYILRPVNPPALYEFVVDADSLPELVGMSEDVLPPGTEYSVEETCPILYERGWPLNEVVTEKEFTSDQWGTFLSAYGPIVDAEDNPVAILGVDMDVTQVHEKVSQRFAIWLWFISILAILISFRFVFLLRKSMYKPLNKTG